MFKILNRIIMAAAALLPAVAFSINLPSTSYLIHSSGKHLVKDGTGNAVIKSAGAPEVGMYSIVDADNGFFNILTSDGKVLSLYGDYDTRFLDNANSHNAQYAIEAVDDFYVTIRCRANDRYLGVDNTAEGAFVYSNKTTPNYWYLSSEKNQQPKIDESSYIVTPASGRQSFEGWGVSLCWWANMCGRWSDDKIDRIIDWLVNPEGLNYRIFRYNIGGGDDPANSNCNLHHMASGKGLRAEMEGFKDSSEGPYIWERDAAQRKIMLKIREKRPDAIFEAFSNTPPYYMTYSGCASGNHNGAEDNLRKECYDEFAQYLVDVCKHYKDEYGIEFRTLEPFNESMSYIWHAGGEQEGCHFDVASQIEFLKILAPKLRDSGLGTKISASDENAVSESVEAFVAYRRAGIMDCIGQWNTHSYVADDMARAKISALCRESGLRLWMSEVGDGGEGISGNLNLARKLIDDMRYIMPSAWLDWQYIEENNDQWGLLMTDNYNNGDAWRTKHYYVRSQFSRFIEPGSVVITSLDPNTLATLSADGSTLVLIALNPSQVGITHNVNLSEFEKVESSISAYITDSTRDVAWFSEYDFDGNYLSFTLAPTSIVTFSIPVSVKPADAGLDTTASYLICPRSAASLAVTASNGHLEIDNISLSKAQQWKLSENGSGYVFTNLNGDIITQAKPDDYHLTYSSATEGTQVFHVRKIDGLYSIIGKHDNSVVFDLEQEKMLPGTWIGMWAYPDTDTEAPVHRQWSLIKIPTERHDASAGAKATFSTEAPPDFRLHNTGTSCLKIECTRPGAGALKIYGVSGMCIYSKSNPETLNTVNLSSGYYIVAYGSTSQSIIIN